MNDFNNEGIHFFIKIKISHTLFSNGWCLLCVRKEWRRGRTAILTQVLPRPLQHFFRILAWVVQPGFTKGPKPSVWIWFSLRHPVSNWLELSGHLVMLLSNLHLLMLFFRLFTPVHLLIDGSVEGQYITFVWSSPALELKQTLELVFLVL